MKPILLIASVLIAVEGLSQGTVLFANAVPSAGLYAPIYYNYVGGGGILLSGPNFYAQLWAGPEVTSLAPIGAPVPFRTGAGAGYWNYGASATRTIDTMPPGATAWIAVYAWDSNGATITTPNEAFIAGRAAGRSDLHQVVLGDASTPALMTGFRSFSIVAIPEPSVFALALLGLGALWLSRKRPAALASREPDPPKPDGT